MFGHVAAQAPAADRSMARKRIHDEFENEKDQPGEKRMHRQPSFSTVTREATVTKQVQIVFMVLEPLLRRVVQEELQAGLVRSPRYIERSSPETTPPPTPPAERAPWRLAFLHPPHTPIFTGSKIEDANGNTLQVILLDAHTGSPSHNVPPQFLRVELVPLFGDFPHDGREECASAAEFARGIVKERAGKRPLLTGDVTLTMRDGRAVVGELQFTDNSSWMRCRKFRVGARVVTGSGYEGPRVAEAMTDAFVVRDHRGELYKKHYPPLLGDDVWRLEKISKEGAFHRKLAQNGVKTVQQFLQMLTVKPDMLRMIMGDGMTDRMWEATTKHARQCDAGDKVFAYPAGQPGVQNGATVYVKPPGGVRAARQPPTGRRRCSCRHAPPRQPQHQQPPAAAGRSSACGADLASGGGADLAPGQPRHGLRGRRRALRQLGLPDVQLMTGRRSAAQEDHLYCTLTKLLECASTYISSVYTRKCKCIQARSAT